MNKPIFKDLNFAATANWDLLNEAAKAAKKRNSKVHIGNIFSSDVFYSEHEDIDREMKRHGVLAVEMEAAELYTIAARYERRALAILTVSDHLITHEALPSKDRERSFGEMVEIALEAAFNETS
jgi:purine-nucleoside phosphorylase